MRAKALTLAGAAIVAIGLPVASFAGGPNVGVTIGIGIPAPVFVAPPPPAVYYPPPVTYYPSPSAILYPRPYYYTPPAYYARPPAVVFGFGGHPGWHGHRGDGFHGGHGHRARW